MLRIVLAVLLVAGIVLGALKVAGILASLAWTFVILPLAALGAILVLLFVFAMVRANIGSKV